VQYVVEEKGAPVVIPYNLIACQLPHLDVFRYLHQKNPSPISPAVYFTLNNDMFLGVMKYVYSTGVPVPQRFVTSARDNNCPRIVSGV